jgi:hypothetical protein
MWPLEYEHRRWPLDASTDGGQQLGASITVPHALPPEPARLPHACECTCCCIFYGPMTLLAAGGVLLKVTVVLPQHTIDHGRDDGQHALPLLPA